MITRQTKYRDIQRLENRLEALVACTTAVLDRVPGNQYCVRSPIRVTEGSLDDCTTGQFCLDAIKLSIRVRMQMRIGYLKKFYDTGTLMQT